MGPSLIYSACLFLRIYVSIKYSAFAKSAQNGVLTGVLTSGCTYVVDLVCWILKPFELLCVPEENTLYQMPNL